MCAALGRSRTRTVHIQTQRQQQQHSGAVFTELGMRYDAELAEAEKKTVRKQHFDLQFWFPNTQRNALKEWLSGTT